jgi:hypothetical protein
VGVETICVRLGTGVAASVTVGALVDVGFEGKVPQATRNMMRIIEDTVDTCFDIFIDESISASNHYDN